MPQTSPPEHAGLREPGNQERSRRATPMAPDDRRAAILAAAVPLLRERGPDVTTRELAEAAGVAEGTIFRVFPDKEALLVAAVQQALDPVPLLAAMAAIDHDLGLRALLVRAVLLLRAHSDDVAVLLSASHQLSGGMPPRGKHMHRHGHHPLEMVVRGLAGLLEPHRSRLRLAPQLCARMLVGVVIAMTRPLAARAERALTAEQIVDLFLDGALVQPAPSESPC